MAILELPEHSTVRSAVNKLRQLVKIGVLLALIAMLLATATPSHAETDKAKLIFTAASALYKENVKRGAYTYWINGDIGKPSAAQRPAGLKVGASLPEINFADFYDPSLKFKLKDLKPPLLLNFWASWCGPCRKEFKIFVKALQDKTLTVPLYLVNVGEGGTNTAAALFVESYAAPLNTLTDPRSRFASKYGIDTIPTTLLIDKDGVIQALQIGDISETGMKFFELIAENPGVGAFDANNPTVMPSTPPKR
jgi:thiol-disulfide isomerase/thioredoxin